MGFSKHFLTQLLFSPSNAKRKQSCLLLCLSSCDLSPVSCTLYWRQYHFLQQAQSTPSSALHQLLPGLPKTCCPLPEAKEDQKSQAPESYLEGEGKERLAYLSPLTCLKLIMLFSHCVWPRFSHPNMFSYQGQGFSLAQIFSLFKFCYFAHHEFFCITFDYFLKYCINILFLLVAEFFGTPLNFVPNVSALLTSL